MSRLTVKKKRPSERMRSITSGASPSSMASRSSHPYARPIEKDLDDRQACERIPQRRPKCIQDGDQDIRQQMNVLNRPPAQALGVSRANVVLAEGLADRYVGDLCHLRQRAHREHQHWHQEMSVPAETRGRQNLDVKRSMHPDVCDPQDHGKQETGCRRACHRKQYDRR